MRRSLTSGKPVPSLTLPAARRTRRNAWRAESPSHRSEGNLSSRAGNTQLAPGTLLARNALHSGQSRVTPLGPGLGVLAHPRGPLFARHPIYTVLCVFVCLL